MAALVLCRVDQGAQTRPQLRRDNRTLPLAVLVRPSRDLERVRGRVGDLVPFLEIRIDPHRLEYPPDSADGALGLVDRDRLSDQLAALGVGVGRLPALDLPGPTEPRQEVGRAARRVGNAPDDFRVNALLAGRLQGALQQGRVMRQQAHVATCVVSVIDVQLG
ncbi:hypothetical protein D3C76_929500 [compost metagenome]